MVCRNRQLKKAEKKCSIIFSQLFFVGKRETLTTLALPGEGKWDASPRGRGRTRKTDASLFTVYCRRGTARRRQHDKTLRPTLKIAAKPPPSEPSEPSEPSYNMFGRGRLEDLSLLDLSPLQHEHAFGIMVIGAIEDIPLNP
ncbi:hypothetical protein, partial [Dialister succinatiphilus]|uniref:hypothetical protein n=1 Tax=Dialister succinatiphilus TaxID=487173 RepID=UPI003AB7389F